MRVRKLSFCLGVAAIGIAVLGAIPAFGADHRDAPLTKAAAKSDLNDVYVFAGASGKPVIAMTVNPLTSPAETAGLSLDPATNYEFKIDTNADATPDIALKLQFSGTGPVQDFTLRQAQGASAVVNDRSGDVLMTGRTSAGSAVTVNTAPSGLKVYVGPRDDPFFFDLAAFQNALKFTDPGTDTFKGTNVTAIVIELADFPGGKQQFGVWSTTSRQDNLSNWVQLDRMGRPAINTVFIGADKKDAFNNNTPDRDVAIYKSSVVAALASLGAGPGLADALLPDILTADFSKPIKYLNGRGLADDVIDISLQAITGNAAASDHVDKNENAFGSAFPYLASPNGGGAPGAPSTGSGLSSDDGDGMTFSWTWTLPAGLLVAAALMGAAGFVNRRRGEGRG